MNTDVNRRTQQFDIYAAEVGLDRGRAFDSVDEVQAFVDDLRETWWWPRWYDRLARVEVGPARSRRKAVGWYDHEMGAGRIEVPPAMRTELTIVHELSHVVAEVYHGSKSHDPAFAREYARLTYLVRGSAAWLRLYDAYTGYGIEYDVEINRGPEVHRC